MKTVIPTRRMGGDATQRRGNAGALENVANQTAVSHVSHRPLEITHGAISTFPLRRRRGPCIRNPKTKRLRLAPYGRSPQCKEKEELLEAGADTAGCPFFRRRSGNAGSKKRACRNRVRQGINHVFWVGFLWPVLK